MNSRFAKFAGFALTLWLVGALTGRLPTYST